MEQVDQYLWYRLAKRLDALLALNTEASVGSAIFAYTRAAETITEFETLPVQYSKSAASEIQAKMRSLVWAHRKRDEAGNETEDIDWNEKIQSYPLSNLHKAINDFETVLAKEAPSIPVFFVPKKGIYNTADLIERAEQDFANYEGLPPDAIKEIQQAGKCLAFDLFTAHAFHMMRAAEIVVLNVLIAYYNITPTTSQRNWGQYIDILQKRGAPPELMRFLFEVVRVERNESIHPTKLLTEIEAQKINTIAKGAIIALVEHVETLEAYDALANMVAASNSES